MCLEVFEELLVVVVVVDIFLLVGGGETLPSSVASRFRVAGGMMRRMLDILCLLEKTTFETLPRDVNMCLSICK